MQDLGFTLSLGCYWLQVMCENSEGPPETRQLQVDGHKRAAELDCPVFTVESPVQISERTRPLHCDVWKAYFDKDGRVVNESALRKAVFKGRNWSGDY